MKLIENIDELRALKPSDKFYVICEGKIRGYYFCSVNPMTDAIIVAIPSFNYDSATTFNSNDFRYGNKVFLSGEYESKVVGKIMTDQLNDEIAKVKRIYCKEHETH